ncbi:CAP2 [Malassezia furfur]|nr:CAP2 [Malassezia furfur]
MSATTEDPLSLSLDLLHRLPPANVTKNVQRLIHMLPDHADDLASSVDQPLTLRIDQSKEGAGREFLCCDYNRDGESWRSWISNTWVPPLQDGDEELAPVPTGKLRELELHANDAFETYQKLYVDHLEGSADATAKGTFGTWDSIHVFEIATVPSSGSADSSTTVKSAKYKLSSTVMLTLNRHDGGASARKNVDLSGSLSRQMEETMKVTDVTNHIINLGRLIEDVESKIRNQLQEIYFGKTHDIVEQLRSLEDLEASRNAKKLQEELVAGWER